MLISSLINNCSIDF